MPNISTVLAAYSTQERMCAVERLAPLGLAFVADGRSDAYVEMHANAWDCVAGLLLVQEAGGLVSPFLDADGLRIGAPVLAASGGIAGTLSELVGIPLKQRPSLRDRL
jgi:myo-inositol-1(or 4)-monophosphatase